MSDSTVLEILRRWRSKDRYIELSPSDIDGLIEIATAEHEAHAEARRLIEHYRTRMSPR